MSDRLNELLDDAAAKGRPLTGVSRMTRDRQALVIGILKRLRERDQKLPACGVYAVFLELDSENDDDYKPPFSEKNPTGFTRWLRRKHPDYLEWVARG